MKASIKQKFPCGYEYEISYEALNRDVDMKEHLMGVCPFHGKNCPNKQSQND